MTPTTAKQAAEYIKSFRPGYVPKDVMDGLPGREIEVFMEDMFDLFDPEELSNHLDDLRGIENEGFQELLARRRTNIVLHLTHTYASYMPREEGDKTLCKAILYGILEQLEDRGDKDNIRKVWAKIDEINAS